MPGNMAISSADMSPMPWESMNAETYSWMSLHLVRISWMMSISSASRFSRTGVMDVPSGIPRESPREWAESVLITIVLYPSSESLNAVAAEVEVFPTPPLPV